MSDNLHLDFVYYCIMILLSCCAINSVLNSLGFTFLSVKQKKKGIFICSAVFHPFTHFLLRPSNFGLILDQLCFSQPCVTVFIFYSELLPISATSPSMLLAILKVLSVSLSRRPGRSCPGPYLLVLHVPRVLIETACSYSSDILLYCIIHTALELNKKESYYHCCDKSWV